MQAKDCTLTIDSPTLDPRLSYLRRASALSAKASLFVLSPIPADELPDFVQSLQEALYESALEYYGAHAKRVRRKRSRLPSSSSFSLSTPMADNVRSLGPQGWAVRYDWKAGWFSEIRGEYEIARRHYEDCWNELAKMFSSTQLLPPRTKRWAEAKVLADCVAVRVRPLILFAGMSRSHDRYADCSSTTAQQRASLRLSSSISNALETYPVDGASAKKRLSSGHGSRGSIASLQSF